MNPTENKQTKTKLKVGIFAGIIIFIGAVIVLLKGAGSGTQDMISNTNNSSAGQNSQTAQTNNTASTVVVYKDGTYSADGNYNSPGGPDSVSVSLTLKDNIVTDATVTPKPGDKVSAKYQDIFISGYKQYVVGKNINDINLSKVSGSSLTPIGFNDALNKIKAEAKA